VGLLVELGAARSAWKLLGALVSADVLILLSGSTWLHVQFGVPRAQAWLLGFYPFLIGDVAKIAFVACALPPVVRWFKAHQVEDQDAGSPRPESDL
jgi:biotin transporter BioY